MSEAKSRRRRVGRTRNNVFRLVEAGKPPLSRASSTAAIASIAGELCLLTTDRKLISVKAKVLSHCDLGNAYAGRQMQPVPLGCVPHTNQMALIVDEESRLIEKLLTFLEIDADDASGQQLQSRLTDSRGILKRGLGPWLFPLLSAADRWGARHLRDLLVSAFVDNVDRVLQPVTPGRHVNPFATLSGGVLKALLLPLLQRASCDQLRTVLALLRDCQHSVHSSNGNSQMCSCLMYSCRKESPADYDGLSEEGRDITAFPSSFAAVCDKVKPEKMTRPRDRSAQDTLALRKVIDLIEDRLEELCNH